ncbi:MAG: diaminopimelate epimerase, partial [Rickettsia sp.]
MTSKINFVKMHGLGNDFVFVNKRDLRISYDLSQLAKNIADRYMGIGCDQFIIYEEHNSFYEMIIYNIDGSSAKLCGNATRCLAKLI